MTTTTKNLTVIELALSYFENGNVPSVKVFTDEVWRPSRADMTYTERKVTDMMADYVFCYEGIKTLRFNSQIFGIRMHNLRGKHKEVIEAIDIPFDIEGLTGMLADAKIKKENRRIQRQIERLENTKGLVLEVNDDLVALNARRAHIMALINELEADTQAVVANIKGEGLGIHVGSLYAPDGVFTIIDKNPEFTWDHKQYSFNVHTSEMTPIKEPDCDCDCDCDDCNN